MLINAPSIIPTHERVAALDRLGDEIAELSAHLEVATARLLDLIRDFDARGGWPGVLGWALPHLNALCGLGRLCVWMSNRGEEPMAYHGEPLRLGLHAADFTSAMILQLILQIEESASVAYCERCGRAYVRIKHDQRFCSFRCASRERQARYRKAKRVAEK